MCYSTSVYHLFNPRDYLAHFHFAFCLRISSVFIYLFIYFFFIYFFAPTHRPISQLTKRTGHIKTSRTLFLRFPNALVRFCLFFILCPSAFPTTSPVPFSIPFCISPIFAPKSQKIFVHLNKKRFSRCSRCCNLYYSFRFLAVI